MKKIFITAKDWKCISALLDTLDEWEEQFINGSYKDIWNHVKEKTEPRVYKQLNKMEQSE